MKIANFICILAKCIPLFICIITGIILWQRFKKLPKGEIPSSKDAEKSVREKETLYQLLWGVHAVFIILAYSIFAYFSFEANQTSGLFGDTFGAINALFAALAFAGIIYTILLQREELSLQRDELRATRDEFKEQNATMRLQRFENTFFNMVSLHHQIVSDMDCYQNIGNQTVLVKGRDVFKVQFNELLTVYLQYELRSPQKENFNEFFKNKQYEHARVIINDYYMDKYEDVQTDFAHYFRNLYRIIKLINEQEFILLNETQKNDLSDIENFQNYQKQNFEKQYKYTSIIRSQLSDYELVWLFYNSISINGIEKFKPLIEKFSLLKNFPRQLISREVYFVAEYNPTAFSKEGIPWTFPI